MKAFAPKHPFIHISETSKLDGIKSWSLQALETCAGSIGIDGNLVPACQGCYATTGFYKMPNVIAPREFNKTAWTNEGFVEGMTKAIYKMKFFRLFDSGDFYTVSLAKKWLQIMKNCPNTKFWVPTRMYKFEKFQAVLNEMNSLPNVVVRFSSDSITGEFTRGLHGSTILPSDNNIPEGVKVCHAYTPENGGKCNGCRACWNKEIPVIGYVAHGKKAKKNVRIAMALVA